MNLELKPIGKTQKNCFIVDVQYIHANGHVDFETENSFILKTTELSDLEKYISFFNTVALAIDKSKDDVEPVDQKIEKLFENKLVDKKYQYVSNVADTSLNLFIKQDLTDDGEDEYVHFAHMKILKIIFINDDREQFVVKY